MRNSSNYLSLPSFFFNEHLLLYSLALIFLFGSCITSLLFFLLNILLVSLDFFFVCEVPHTPPLSPIKGPELEKAPCKVQKTTVKDNNWVSYKKEEREEGGETQQSEVWVKTLPSNSTNTSFVTKGSLHLMWLFIVISYNDSIKSAEATKKCCKKKKKRGEDECIKLCCTSASLIETWE